MILGVVIIIVALFSGFPPEFNTVAYIILGILVIATAYLMQPARSSVEPGSPYTEHSPSTAPSDSSSEMSAKNVAPAPSISSVLSSPSPEIKQ